MAKGLSPQEVGRLARIGAATRLAELQEEMAALRRAFPGLKAAGPAAAAADVAAAPKPGRKARRRRREMSAAGKKAVSDRMKKYWAERKKGKA